MQQANVQQNVQRAHQKLTFTQQLAQNIALLSCPVMQLRHEVLSAVTENPALEIREEPDHESIEALQDKERFSRSASNGNPDLIENLLASPQTLREYLLRQLHLNLDDDTRIEIGERIIESLDEHGFLTESAQQLCSGIEGASEKIISQVVSLIQTFDPPGCACANAAQSLAAQIDQLDIGEKEKASLCQCVSLMEDAPKNDEERLAAEKRIASYTASADIQKYLYALTPYPGLAYNPNITPAPEAYIVPDAVIVEDAGELRVRINTDIVPVVDINEDMQKAAHSEDKQVASFASRLVNSAQSFITGLQYRSSSLEKVALFIARAQAQFFTGAQEYPNPLTRKDIAEALELNESTVSRVVSGKYIQTPRGIFEMKRLFSHSVGSIDVSAAQVEQDIRAILADHEQSEKTAGKKKSLSDEKIAGLLAKRGIFIARRTVAKYRKKIEDGRA